MPSKKQLIPNNNIYELPTTLVSNIIYQIESAKSQVASYTNSTLVMLYWHIGSLINQEILNNKRAEYEEQILSQIAKRLTLLYGNGFDFATLSRMVKFSKLYPYQEIVVTVSQQLSWSHIISFVIWLILCHSRVRGNPVKSIKNLLKLFFWIPAYAGMTSSRFSESCNKTHIIKLIHI